ncbi:glycoside hydrolase family 65 protein [Geotoga petraea]|uniref:Glycoside hydrolase family 65 protein n=1 Tax=Geotoga petraea TaxID=28234 RepID=A0A4Z0W2R6_9BACT|nr:glycosyl hydrolase family 65 protein [Geotoga petraea]TGG88829.1 glycoside hydrolase family 65 protein [Geotoga petraea]
MNDSWYIVQNEFLKDNFGKYETVFTLANGYRGYRGINEFSEKNEKGNFIAGIYDKSEAQVNEIVNNPDNLTLNIYVDYEILKIDESNILNFKRTLDMKSAKLITNITFETKKGKQIKVEAERFVSKNNFHRTGLKYKITPLNFSGKITLENIIDGSTTNSIFDPINRVKHYNIIKTMDLSPGMLMLTKTRDKGILVCEATTIKAQNNGQNILKSRNYRKVGQTIQETYEFLCEKDSTYIIEKFNSTFSSRETKNPELMAQKDLREFFYNSYDQEFELHKKEWEKIWNKIDIKIEGDEEAQKGIRFNIFQLTSSANEKDDTVSIPAKGLHGEGYKGHIFWDTEIFMLPFFIYTSPETAKSLLLYRYNTLKGARKNAQINGYKGAQFPWEAADKGIEETPKWGIDYVGNPVRIWTGDEEYHISADIALSFWEYYRTVQDESFLLDYGVEIFFDTAKFWKSRLEYNSKTGSYEINKVIGPDEFHEHVNNNFYTNYLAKWNLKKAYDLSNWLKERHKNKYDELCVLLGLNDNDFLEFLELSKKIYLPKKENSNLIEQFEGYFNLKNIVITEWDNNGMPLWPKNIELDKLGETQLIKQPDVIMLMLILQEEFDKKTKKINYDYYEKRTMHKSSLSPSMYSIMGLKVGDTHNAYKYFMKTIMTDLEDNQGNSNAGLHAASTGGSWQSAVMGFGGLSVDIDNILNFDPWIPDKWESLSYKINWKGKDLNIKVKSKSIEFLSEKDLIIKVQSKKYNLIKGQKKEIELS